MSNTVNDSSPQTLRHIEPNKRLAIAIALIAVICAVAWNLSRGSSSNVATGTNDTAAQSSTAATTQGLSLQPLPATIVSAPELLSATKDLGVAIYWNGKMKDTKLELTILSEGKIYVRYLPKDAVAGATEPYFTVATYFDPEAFAKVQNLGSSAGAKFVQYTGGAVAASASESDSNVYFAFDGNPALYNIYAPDPKVAWNALDTGTLALLQ